jgi:EAL and modified HD-GYP domain-containing signal transduction protein
MDVFVARQPIFDTKKNVSAYELLFRSSIENFYNSDMDADFATSKVVSDSFLVIGLKNLTRGKRAFINFTRNLIVKEAPSAIPKELIAVEILEDVEPDDEVIKACKALKQSGYIMVLDDFVFHERFRPLIELVDIIKVDFTITKSAGRRSIIHECHNNKIKFLAEKVETIEDFKEALDLGYSYFQGYFFSKPTVLSKKDIPGNKLIYIKVLNEINRPDVSFENIEEIIKRDLSLSYKLFQFINSAFFGFKVRIESIKHAMVMLGIEEMKKWASLIVLSNLGYDKPQELLILSLIRAKIFEFIAPKIGLEKRSSDLFMMGLFSVIDALIDRPMEEVLSEIPIAEDIKKALLGEENILNDVYELVLAYEQGDWGSTSQYLNKLRIDEKELPGFYFESVKWANMTL